jgi:Glycosyltransferase
MRALFICTYGDFAATFEKNNINILQNIGYEVHVASNFADASKNRNIHVLEEMQVILHHINFDRSPFTKQGLKNLKELDKLIAKYHFEEIDCHNPVCGVLGRICGKKNHVPNIIYTAHGFHFFKGAPLKNWLLYFPAEWLCSWLTDILITINKEDYVRAKKHLHAKRTEYIPGVGINVEKYTANYTDREEKRKELGLNVDDFVVISVGELNCNKNHKVIIEAIAKLKNAKIKYIICGQGELAEYLTSLIKQYNLEKQIYLLGYRSDIKDLLSMADLFAFPSLREGLSMSLMEAMASGLPIICGNIRGNNDLVEEGKGGYLITENNINRYADAIRKIMSKSNEKEIMGNYNQKKVRKFDKYQTNKLMKDIYSKVIVQLNKNY